jgi:hypothetical protein
MLVKSTQIYVQKIKKERGIKQLKYKNLNSQILKKYCIKKKNTNQICIFILKDKVLR